MNDADERMPQLKAPQAHHKPCPIRADSGTSAAGMNGGDKPRGPGRQDVAIGHMNHQPGFSLSYRQMWIRDIGASRERACDIEVEERREPEELLGKVRNAAGCLEGRYRAAVAFGAWCEAATFTNAGGDRRGGTLSLRDAGLLPHCVVDERQPQGSLGESRCNRRVMQGRTLSW